MVSHVGSVTLPNPCAVVQLTLVFASSCEEPVRVKVVEILYGEHHINPGWWQSETRGPGGLSNAAQEGKSCKVVGCHCTAVQDQGHTSQGTSNAGNGKIKNWLVKEKDYEPGLGSGTPRTVYLPSLTQGRQEQGIFRASLTVAIFYLLLKCSPSHRRESQEGALTVTHLLLQPRASPIP